MKLFQGWGYEQTIWEGFVPPNARGKLVITHSFGLHQVSSEHLSDCELLVIIGGFKTFPEREHRRIEKMKHLLQKRDLEVLKKFHARCFEPKVFPKDINWEKLIKDLELLQHCSLKPFEDPPPILILHGDKDVIVPMEEAVELQKTYPESTLRIIPDAGHGLPFTHTEICWKHIQEKLFKLNVAKNFSNASERYHAKAHVQKKIAKYLQLETLELPKGDILEIGCGTGFVSQQIIKKFPDRQLLLTDIAPNMVQFCQKKYSAKNCQFQILDGEQGTPGKKWACIISGMSFQWFWDLPTSLKQLQSQLLPGGTLLFSCLGEESFPEWKQACTRAKVPFTGLPLPSKGLIQDALPQCVIEEKKITVPFPSPKDFFAHLKMLGMQATRRPSLTPMQAQKLFQSWENGQVTYSLLLVKSRQL